MTPGAAPLLALALVAAAGLLLRLGHRRQGRLVGAVVDPGVEGPAILYFSGRACTICHTAQRPVLDRLTPALEGRVAVREVDVAENRHLARRFRVMSLPTTVVLDAQGRALAVNAGFAPASVLRTQLSEAGLLK